VGHYPALTDGASPTQSRSSTALSIASATSARPTLFPDGRAVLKDGRAEIV